MTRIAIISSRSAEAEAARDELTSQYDTVEADQADVIVALGGDGFMLHTLHACHAPLYPPARHLGSYRACYRVHWD